MKSKKGVVSFLQEFSIPLIAGVVCALLAANLAPEWYRYWFGSGHGDDVWHLPGVSIFGHPRTLHFFINDVFMVFFFGVAGLASLGLPGLSGFVAEFHVFLGTFNTYPWAAALGIFAAAMTAVYILRMMAMSFWGPFNEQWNDLKEMTYFERATGVLMLAFLLFMGLWPAPFVDRIQESVRNLPGVT